jgi:hypothetical protein
MGYAASRGRTVILHDDGRLTIVEGSSEVELARWAADVSVEDDGEHALFVALRTPDTAYGEDTEDPETGEVTTVAGGSAEMTPEMGTRSPGRPSHCLAPTTSSSWARRTASPRSCACRPAARRIS